MQIQIHGNCLIMSDLNLLNKEHSSSINVMCSDKLKENVNNLKFRAEKAVKDTCDDIDHDKDVIFAHEHASCDHENFDLASKESTLLLNKQLDKLHITSEDPVKSYVDRVAEHSNFQFFDFGNQLHIYNNEAMTNPIIKTDNINEKNLKMCDCKNIFKSNLLKGNVIAQHVKLQIDLPCALCSEQQTNSGSHKASVRTCCWKKNLMHLQKSQSLDLYHDCCSAFNTDQQLHNQLFPHIEEIQSQSSSSAPNSMKTQTSQAEYFDISSEEKRLRSICRPNITASMIQSSDSRPIYPNVPYSPYSTPYSSPRSIRRRAPLRESRRISIEKSGSFLQLNQYKLMDQIGQGSYGLVKLAYSDEDSTHYAMKILSKKRLLRQAAFIRGGPKQKISPLDRVYREIAVLKKLDHPNIVKLIEVLDDPMEDSLYMVFEWVKHGEVLSIPTDKPLSEERAWSVFRDSLLGLEYLHYQKIVHADLKPGNLLLTEHGLVKIADLGVCNEFFGDDSTMSNGATGGTPAFRAPETLVLGKNVFCGRAADVWALGATLFSLVYGNVPFLANSIPLLYEKIKNEVVVFPDTPKISSGLKHCIIQMLNKDPTYRINLPQLKVNSWVTKNGSIGLPTEDQNCCLVHVDEEDINSVVRSIPKLDTLILIKTMLKNHSFGNPFIKSPSARACHSNESRLEKFVQSGRSNSAPGSYHKALQRESSSDRVLPALTEHCFSKQNEEI